ncbi:hypothetical protein [Streptomyces sp. NPDC046925]|uniref:hypothetical protein n=1 Tax=Streptomyces sp. NPDC046925 TaxID=3155375 RepID=UPI00340AEF6D
MSIPRSLIHPLRTRRARRMVALLDEADPVERAFQALVIEHPEHLVPRRKRSRGGVR